MKLINAQDETLVLPPTFFMNPNQMAREMNSQAYTYKAGSVLTGHKRFQDKLITLKGSWWLADNPSQDIYEAIAFMYDSSLKLFENDDDPIWWPGVELESHRLEWIQRNVEADLTLNFKIPSPFKVGQPQSVSVTATSNGFTWTMPNNGQFAVNPYLVKITPQSGASFENPRVTNTTSGVVSTCQINGFIDDTNVLTLNMQDFTADLDGSSIVASFDDDALMNPLVVPPENPTLAFAYDSGSGNAVIEVALIPQFY